jgi:hypothetical protein
MKWTMDGAKHGKEWDEELGVFVCIQPVKETDTHHVILELAWDGERWSLAHFRRAWAARRA